MPADQLFHVGQKAFIAKEGKVLVLREPTGELDFPGGRIQEGETNTVEALQREVREETGLEIKVGEPLYTWIKEFGPSHQEVGGIVYLISFRCKYVSGEIVLSEEHASYQWVDKATYQELAEDTAYFSALKKYFSQ